MCPVLCEWLLLEEEPVLALSLSLPVWLKARLDSINTLGRTRNNSESVCVLCVPISKSPTCRRYLHILEKSEIISTFLFYWVSFWDFNNCTLRAARTTNENWWIELILDVLHGLLSALNIKISQALFCIFLCLFWILSVSRRDSDSFQDVLLEHTGSQPAEDWFWCWPYARQALKKHITTH